MNVGRLIECLSTFPADLPVVLAAQDDPLGDYEVMSADRRQMERDPTYDRCGLSVWHHANPGFGEGRHEAVRDVVFLGLEDDAQSVVDAEPVRAELSQRNQVGSRS